MNFTVPYSGGLDSASESSYKPFVREFARELHKQFPERLLASWTELFYRQKLFLAAFYLFL